MKSSACCTTRSKTLPLRFALALLPLVTAVGLHAQAPSPQEPAELNSLPTAQAILDANSLQGEGKRPFHLRMSFAIFDLQGAPAEQGTAEYWWAGPGSTLLQAATPSLGTVHSTAFGDAKDAVAARSLFLIGELLAAVHSPGADLELVGSQLASESRKVNSVKLQCMHTAGTVRYADQSSDVCADTSGTIRLITYFDAQITRNRSALFGDERTALDITIAFGGRKSITGHVEQLQSIDPKNSPFALEKRPASAEQNPFTGGARGVIAGTKISGPRPRYPETARERRISGRVVLLAEISKEGTIAHLWPLASPDPLLTQAAMDAASQWVYRPWLLNGEPTVAYTTIASDFNLTMSR